MKQYPGFADVAITAPAGMNAASDRGSAGETAGGMEIAVRDLRRDDADALDRLFDQMSEQSRYLRFHGAVATLNGALRNSLLAVDQRDHVALLAHDRGVPVGVARFIRDPDNPVEAETAVAVGDRWQRRGVARQLMVQLARRAALVDIVRLSASILPWNRPALGLFRSVFPDRIDRHGDGVIDLVGLIEAGPDRKVGRNYAICDRCH